MSTRANATNLIQAAKELSVEWNQTKSQWRDAKSQEFEKKYLEELPGLVTRTAAAIEEIDELLGKVRSDCE